MERPRIRLSKIIGIAAPVLGAGLVISAAGCKDGGDTAPVGTPTPILNDFLTDCPAGPTLSYTEQGDVSRSNLLSVSFPGREVPEELQAVIDERKLCFFTYARVDGNDKKHLLWAPNQTVLEEAKAELDPLVEKGVITSVDFEDQKSAQITQ